MIASDFGKSFLGVLAFILWCTVSAVAAVPSCPTCSIEQVGNLGDAIVLVPDYKGGTGSVYLVNTRSFLMNVVDWKMAFVIYRKDNRDEYWFALSPWRNPERDSAHAVIRRAMNVVTGSAQPLDFNVEPVGFREVQRGYLKPSGKTGIEIFDLSGASIYRYSGYNGSELSAGAETVKDAFWARFSIVVDFSPPDEVGEIDRNVPSEQLPEKTDSVDL